MNIRGDKYQFSSISLLFRYSWVKIKV